MGRKGRQHPQQRYRGFKTTPDVHGTFRYLLKRIPLRLKPGQQPGIHGLRHLYAVRGLESCPVGYDRAARHILALSTYLGHTHVANTYWYLQTLFLW